VPRYRLSIAYDGSAFCGWQRQLMPIDLARAHGHDTATPDADGRIELRSVQSSIIRAIRDVTLQTVNLVGASRTDAGVHARAQTAAFTLTETDGEKRRGPADDRLAAALNSRLPEDVVVRSAVRTTDDFDPIAGCLAKGYSYLFHVEHPRPLWDRPYVHHVRENLSAAAMADAAQAFIGTHDFAAFAAAGHGRDSTLRTVIHCAAHESVSSFGERRIRIDIAADGFLWNMVRIIAGTLMEVGKGRLTPDAIRSALQSGDRRAAGPTLPPTGLCLEWGAYSEAELADRTRDLAIAPELLDAVRASAVERKRRNAEWAARNDGDGDGGGVFHVEHPEHDSAQPGEGA
jgi:tRNA pseudouridine38-40 synthase